MGIFLGKEKNEIGSIFSKKPDTQGFVPPSGRELPVRSQSSIKLK